MSASLSKVKSEFLEFLLQSGVLLFGDFTTKSGRKSPYFINAGNFSTGDRLNRLGEFYATALIGSFGTSFTNIFGPAYKGIPLGVCTAMALERKFAHSVSVSFNRKEAKTHGDQGKILGHPYQKEVVEKVVIVEDVITAGTSLRQCIPLLRGYGMEVVGALVAVDRMEKGLGDTTALAEIQKEFKVSVGSLVDLKDLILFLTLERGRFGISDEALKELLSHSNRYPGIAK